MAVYFTENRISWVYVQSLGLVKLAGNVKSGVTRHSMSFIPVGFCVYCTKWAVTQSASVMLAKSLAES